MLAARLSNSSTGAGQLALVGGGPARAREAAQRAAHRQAAWQAWHGAMMACAL